MYRDVLSFSFVEPEESRLMREIGVDYIVDFIGEPLTKQLLPEQIRVLLSHAYRIYGYYCFSKLQFIREFRREVEQIAKQEIEPGMFKNEDTL
jgi:hypothetical protein